MTATWRPPRLTPTGLDFAGLAPRGHIIVGCVVREDGGSPLESLWTPLAMPVAARALPVVLAEVLDVGERCPGVEVGDRVLIQRFSGAAGIDPERLRPFAPEVADRYSAIQVVRCGNGIRAQDPGVDTALVATAKVAKWRRDFVRDDKGRSPDDPKALQAVRDLAMTDALMQAILARRAGRAVNGAVLAAGLQTGDDGAAFDGVVAVVDP